MTTVYTKKALLKSGWAENVRFHVGDGAIEKIEIGEPQSADDSVVGIIIPGLCNAHSHAFQRALSGHTEQRAPTGRDNFWIWRERMYELANRIDAKALTAIATQAYTEMLASGYTSVAEFHYLHRDPADPTAIDTMFEAISTAAEKSGIRLTYVPVHYERAGFDEPEPRAHQKSFSQSIAQFIAHWQRVVEQPSANITVGIGAHSLRAVSSASLQAIAEIANDVICPMHLHIAEQQQEVDQSLTLRGRRPVRWLLENYAVGSHWNLVHATHMDPEEIQALAASAAVAVLCPSTEANLGDGLFPLHEFLSNDGRIAIGSDSHVSINPFEELRWLEYGQRLASQSRNVATLRESHTGSELFLRALEGGAAAGGQGNPGLVVGAAADFVVLNDEDPMLLGHDDESRLDALVFSGYPLPVERVMVNGEWRIVDAIHVERDEVRQDFAAAIKRVGARL